MVNKYKYALAIESVVRLTELIRGKVHYFSDSHAIVVTDC